MAGGFGAVLRRLRERAGLTQDELERRSGVSVSTIRGLETGKRGNPRMTTVRQLADALALRSEDREELLGAAVPGYRGAGSDTAAGPAAATAARTGDAAPGAAGG
ncbi:helix-turn-helix transcriptional regulator, partial [Streptomyces sp. SID10815]|uniref:helix-turn-helix domain-containing protein n=1 Tax=Streptomyces sp. SID10815 TaxID=2706027 RepID=UPI0013CC1BF6|nr:helix-turn-helix transcriptional regulator [Streptomyces sp. SID10815]